MNPLKRQNRLVGLRGTMAKVREESLAPKKPLARPRVGSRGASGPGGKWFQEKMIADLTRITFQTKHPHFETATKLSRVLGAALRGELFLENFGPESETVNGILVKVLKANNALSKKQPKVMKLTPLEQATLDSLYSQVKRSKI